MKFSLSVNLSDILTEKKSVLENLFSWGSIFSNFLRPHSIFSLLKETRIEGIELVASKDIGEKDLKKIKVILKEHGVSVFSLHQPILNLYKISLEKIGKLFETADYLSAKVVVLHLFSVRKRMAEKSFLEELKSLERKYGIKISLENGTKNIILGLYPCCYKEKEFSETVSRMGFNITFDTSHLAQAGGDIISFYKRNKERIINIHLSDYKSGFFKHNLFNMHLPLGKGVLPIKEFLQELKNDRYDGLLTFEINRPPEEIKKSIDFARKFLD